MDAVGFNEQQNLFDKEIYDDNTNGNTNQTIHT